MASSAISCFLPSRLSALCSAQLLRASWSNIQMTNLPHRQMNSICAFKADVSVEWVKWILVVLVLLKWGQSISFSLAYGNVRISESNLVQYKHNKTVRLQLDSCRQVKNETQFYMESHVPSPDKHNLKSSIKGHIIICIAVSSQEKRRENLTEERVTQSILLWSWIDILVATGVVILIFLLIYKWKTFYLCRKCTKIYLRRSQASDI